MTVERFARAIVAYRQMTGATVVSWGRSHKYNRSYRAHDASLHLADLAVDVIYDDPLTLSTVRNLADACGLTLRREPHHDHLEPLTGGS